MSIVGTFPSEINAATSAESIKSTEAEGSRGHKGLWSELPSLPLEKIYSYGSRNDQLNISLVCRNWSTRFISLSVWKTFRFALTQSQLSMATCPVMKFVRKYSSMFRHVEILCCFIFNRDIAYTWCRYFVEFLQTLTNKSQFISVEFLDLVACFHYLDTPEYIEICEEINEFLGSQRFLKRVEFHQCFFESKDCVKILQTLTQSSRESFKHFALTKFTLYVPIDIREYDLAFEQSLSALFGHPSIRTIEIDYSLTFENIVKHKLISCQTPVLSKLILECHDLTSEMVGLSSADWRFFKRLFPKMQLELSIDTETTTNEEVEFFIVSNMPISKLHFRSLLTHIEYLDIDVMFNHLLACRLNDQLVSLHLEFYEIGSLQNLASYFIPFLQACEKLKCFQLCMDSYTQDIELLLQSWLENRPGSLREIIIDIACKDDQDEYINIMGITTEYALLLEPIGLNLTVNLNFGG